MNRETLKNKLKPIVFQLLILFLDEDLRIKILRLFVIIVGLEKSIRNWACLIKLHL